MVGGWTRRRPVVAYFLLACAISWVAVAPLVGAWLGLVRPLAPAWHAVGALGPIAAAILVTAAGGGREGLRELWGRATRWRARIALWVLAVASPLVLVAAAAALLRVAGRPWPDIASLRAAWAAPGWVANFLAASLAYGIGEEPGWRGFALPRLQSGRSALRATAILTALWALWHAPYFTYRYHLAGVAAYAGFLVSLAAGAVWLTFLYNSSGGSVLLVILWHIVWNAVNVAAAAVSGELVAVTSALVIPLGVAALVAGGSSRLSWSEKHVIAPPAPEGPRAPGGASIVAVNR